MKRSFNFFKFVILALVTLCCFTSCKKDDPEINIPLSAVTYDGKTYDVETSSVELYEESDGVDFYLIDSDGNTLVLIETALSLKGKKIDLSELDPYAGQTDHWKFYVEPDESIADWWLWGDDDEDTYLADEGYLTFDYKEEDLGTDSYGGTKKKLTYSVEVYAKVNGKVFTAQSTYYREITQYGLTTN